MKAWTEILTALQGAKRVVWQYGKDTNDETCGRTARKLVKDAIRDGDALEISKVVDMGGGTIYLVDPIAETR